MYVYSYNSGFGIIKSEDFANFIESKQAARLNESFLLSTEEKLSTGKTEYKYTLTFKDFLDMYDGGECINLLDDIEGDELLVTKCDIINFSKNELTPQIERRIYESSDPSQEIELFISENIGKYVDSVLTRIQKRKDMLNSQIETKTFQWDA